MWSRTHRIHERTLLSLSLIISIVHRPNEERIVATKKNKLFIKLGDVISFAELSHQKLLSKDNHLYKILRVRYDITWDDVVSNYFKN